MSKLRQKNVSHVRMEEMDGKNECGEGREEEWVLHFAEYHSYCKYLS